MNNHFSYFYSRYPSFNSKNQLTNNYFFTFFFCIIYYFYYYCIVMQYNCFNCVVFYTHPSYHLFYSRHSSYNSHSRSHSQDSMYDVRGGGSSSNSSNNYPPAASSMPVHPDVKFINLPFFSVIDVLVKPTSLGNDFKCFVLNCIEEKINLNFCLSNLNQ